jgi:predicted outer membrane protein
MTRLDSRMSQFDRQFIEHAIAGNRLEIQALELALARAQNEEWRALIQAMIAMHMHDLEMAVAAAERLGLNTEPDLTDVRVYPETPNYDLGMRRVDLVARYLDPLMDMPGGIPTDTPPAVPTIDLTGTPTALPTVDLTGTPTAVPTEEITATPSAVPTENLTGTPTSVPTEDLTGTPTTLPTDVSTETTTALATPVVSETPTPIATIDLTGTPASSPTALLSPTPGDGGMFVSFDLLSIHVIEEIHLMQLETALVAQRLVKNDEVRAFAKHAADMAGLHLILMSDLKHRLFDGYTPPPPDFERDYQGPRRFLPDVE